jgi:sortase (surface protein transpeptidase)
MSGTVKSFSRLFVLAALTMLASVMSPFAPVTEPGAVPAHQDAPASQESRVEPIDQEISVAVSPAASSIPASDTQPVVAVEGLRIAVPRLGIDLPLDVGDIGRDVPRPGYSGSTPEGVALLFPGTSVPGTGGNSYIYAHARVGMFLPLWGARIDDVVVVSGPDRSVIRTYKIALVVPRVDPADAHWLEAGGRERLTLQTSTGPRPADPRFIAVAYPVD